jgi:RecJ-like exonuclease
MKRIAASLATALFALTLAAAAFAATEPSRYGAPVTAKKSVPVAKLAEAPAKYEGKTVRIEGTVSEVCQGRGCWVRVKDEKGQSFLAKSLDESVLLPKDCAGQYVVVQGVVTALKAKPHEHEEGVEGHSCPTPEYVVSTQGIELRPAKK